jgi:exonuclease SbcC
VTRLQLHAKHQESELQQAQQQACSSTQQLQATSTQLAAHQQQLAAALSQQEALEQQLQQLQQERDQQVEELQQQLGAAQEAERCLSTQLSQAGQVHSSMSAKLSALKGKLGLTEEEARSYVQVGPAAGWEQCLNTRRRPVPVAEQGSVLRLCQHEPQLVASLSTCNASLPVVGVSFTCMWPMCVHTCRSWRSSGGALTRWRHAATR